MKDGNDGKEAKEIISKDEIAVILSRYRIGKKPLAKLLGWGDTTVIRYMDGDLPTNEYSDKLRYIMDNPIYYLELLTKNKDKLTAVAYNKSKNAVIHCLLASKLSMAAQYIINLAKGEICASTVQAMLYYSQGFYLAFYEQELFREECQTGGDTMPYPKLYNVMKAKGIYMLDFGEELLSEKEKELMISVVEAFGWYGAKALKTIISYERTSLKVTKNKNNEKIIAKETLKNYFKEIRKQYKIETIAQLKKYPDQRFNQIKMLMG